MRPAWPLCMELSRAGISCVARTMASRELPIFVLCEHVELSRSPNFHLNKQVPSDYNNDNLHAASILSLKYVASGKLECLQAGMRYSKQARQGLEAQVPTAAKQPGLSCGVRSLIYSIVALIIYIVAQPIFIQRHTAGDLPDPFMKQTEGAGSPGQAHLWFKTTREGGRK